MSIVAYFHLNISTDYFWTFSRDRFLFGTQVLSQKFSSALIVVIGVRYEFSRCTACGVDASLHIFTIGIIYSLCGNKEPGQCNKELQLSVRMIYCIDHCQICIHQFASSLPPWLEAFIWNSTYLFLFAVRWDCEREIMSDNIYTFTMVEDQVNSMQRRCMEITWINPADKNFLLVRFSIKAIGKCIQLPQRKRVTLWRACC